MGLFFGSERNIAYKVKKDTRVDISHQTIENWILEYETPNNNFKTTYSSYYIFDVEWVKLKAFGTTDSLYSTVNRILLLLMKYTLKRILRT